MTTTTNETRREVIIDTEISKTWKKFSGAMLKHERATDSIHRVVRDRQHRGRWGRSFVTVVEQVQEMAQSGTDYTVRRAQDALDTYVAARDAEKVAERVFAEADEKYEGWSRFFLVTNSNGHIHRNMNCSTCRPSTVFAWLPDLSGLTEKDAVDEHGTILCSVCFPTAPAEWTVGKPAATDKCSGSGQYAPARERQPRYADCPECGKFITRTPNGNVRAHKPEVAS